MSHQDIFGGMRAAMRRLGSTVSVVTARRGDERFAMTATALTSLSMEPPSLLVCVNRSAAIHPALSEAAEFCINVLAADQLVVASACGGKLKGDERFSEGTWAETESRLPYLVDAQANLVCDLDGKFDYGTHTVFIGRVKRIDTREQINPLGYLNGDYITAPGTAPALAVVAARS